MARRIPAEVLDTNVTAANGKAGALVRCTCRTHAPGRDTAIVSAAAYATGNIDAERIHGMVTLANHPALSRAPQVRLNGPWAA